jgi:hypothetical protein
MLLRQERSQTRQMSLHEACRQRVGPQPVMSVAVVRLDVTR